MKKGNIFKMKKSVKKVYISWELSKNLKWVLTRSGGFEGEEYVWGSCTKSTEFIIAECWTRNFEKYPIAGREFIISVIHFSY